MPRKSTRARRAEARPLAELEPVDWPSAREALKEAIRATFPLLVSKWLQRGDRIAGIGLYINPLWGTIKLRLLAEGALPGYGPEDIDDIYEWPGTSWGREEDVSLTFQARWERWQERFGEHKKAVDARRAIGQYDDADLAVWMGWWRGQLRIGCEAIRDLEAEGYFAGFPMTEKYKVIVMEPNEEQEFPGLPARRYPHFLQTGIVLLQQDFPPDQRPEPRPYREG